MYRSIFLSDTQKYLLYTVDRSSLPLSISKNHLKDAIEVFVYLFAVSCYFYTMPFSIATLHMDISFHRESFFSFSPGYIV